MLEINGSKQGILSLEIGAKIVAVYFTIVFEPLIFL